MFNGHIGNSASNQELDEGIYESKCQMPTKRNSWCNNCFAPHTQVLIPQQEKCRTTEKKTFGVVGFRSVTVSMLNSSLQIIYYIMLVRARIWKRVFIVIIIIVISTNNFVSYLPVSGSESTFTNWLAIIFPSIYIFPIACFYRKIAFIALYNTQYIENSNDVPLDVALKSIHLRPSSVCVLFLFLEHIVSYFSKPIWHFSLCSWSCELLV